jgi:catechol 2,3-dioxygenase-like lactoylglutathione lyase family enzyme
MNLGTFSISLNVKDIRASFAFYQKFGFQKLDGNIDQRWLILKNGDAKIGLFQEVIPMNTLTFNPTDVRAVQKELKAQGVAFSREADPATKGPDWATTTDPDGNPILLDQHND